MKESIALYSRNKYLMLALLIRRHVFIWTALSSSTKPTESSICHILLVLSSNA